MRSDVPKFGASARTSCRAPMRSSSWRTCSAEACSGQQQARARPQPLPLLSLTPRGLTSATLPSIFPPQNQIHGRKEWDILGLYLSSNTLGPVHIAQNAVGKVAIASWVKRPPLHWKMRALERVPVACCLWRGAWKWDVDHGAIGAGTRARTDVAPAVETTNTMACH